MTDTITETRPFAIGDRVTYSEGGRDYTGTVRGIYHAGGIGNDGTPAGQDDSLFVVGSEWRGDYALSTGRQGGDRTFAPDAQDDEQGHWVAVRWDNPRHAEPEPEPEPPTAAALSESAAQVTALEAQVSDLSAQVAAAHNVLSRIGEALRETADRSEWCGEYDRQLAALADSLPNRYGFTDSFRETAQREREWEVCVHWTESSDYSTTVTVAASSLEDAIAQVENDPDAYVDRGYASPNDTEVSWDEFHDGS